MNNNPLILLGERPDFGAVRPEHVAPAIDRLLAAADAALDEAVSDTVPHHSVTGADPTSSGSTTITTRRTNRPIAGTRPSGATIVVATRARPQMR